MGNVFDHEAGIVASQPIGRQYTQSQRHQPQARLQHARRPRRLCHFKKHQLLRTDIVTLSNGVVIRGNQVVRLSDKTKYFAHPLTAEWEDCIDIVLLKAKGKFPKHFLAIRKNCMIKQTVNKDNNSNDIKGHNLPFAECLYYQAPLHYIS